MQRSDAGCYSELLNAIFGPLGRTRTSRTRLGGVGFILLSDEGSDRSLAQQLSPNRIG